MEPKRWLRGLALKHYAQRRAKKPEEPKVARGVGRPKNATTGPDAAALMDAMEGFGKA